MSSEALVVIHIKDLKVFLNIEKVVVIGISFEDEF